MTNPVTLPAAEVARLRAIEAAAREVIRSHRCAETSHGQAPEMFALDRALAPLPIPNPTESR